MGTWVSRNRNTQQSDLHQDVLRGKEDLTGQTFGRLIVLRHAGYKILQGSKPLRNYFVECECSCPEHKIVFVGVQNLKKGNTKSCGCFNSESITKRQTTHNLSRSSTFNSWHSMINRCKHPNNPRYHDYGGRGITYDPRWEDFSAFLEDMGEKPSKEHSIERINNLTGNYCKENCIWASRDVQASNRRNSIYVLYKGEKMILKQCSKISGKIYGTLCYQIKKFRKSGLESPKEIILMSDEARPIGVDLLAKYE